jgi:hypothetical protein
MCAQQGGSAKANQAAASSNQAASSWTLNSITLKVPLLSTVNIISITSNGTAFTVTCDQPGCGLSVGEVVNLGEGLPVGCADTVSNVNAVTGNTAILGNTGSCTADSGPYANQLGQIGMPLTFMNAASQSTSFAQVTQTADGHWQLQVFHSGSLQTKLDARADGPISLASKALNNSIGVGPDALSCVGQPYADENGNCVATGFATGGMVVRYRNLASIAGDGFPFIVYGASAASSPNLTNYVLFTTPTTGYGAATLYRITFYSVETGVAPEGTLTYTVSYTDESGTNSQTSEAFPMATSGAKAVYTTLFSAVGGTNITISTALGSSPLFKFYVTLEAL